MERILFLDIDGVLNHHDAPSIHHEKALLPECIKYLNMATTIGNCKIVVISNWAQQMSVPQLSQMLYAKGVVHDSVVDAITMVPLDDSGLVMGIEKDRFVAQYVKNHDLEKYVIVDDNFPNASSFSGHLVAPNMHVGLTENDVVLILTLLQ